MEYPLCLHYGFIQSRIDEILRLLELGERDQATAAQLQSQVILPGLSAITEEFYNYLQMHREFKEYFTVGEQLTRMTEMQEQYLRSLGVNFHAPGYFEERLRVGITHSHINMPPRLYECAYTKLKQLIVEHIPATLDKDSRSKLSGFIDRIISLDMTLALESYFQSRIDTMQTSLSELEAAQEKMRKQSIIDTATGAASRNAVLGFIKECLALQSKGGEPVSIAMCRLEDIQQVNTEYGRMVGDVVLKKAVEKILPLIRKSDMLGRYGGTEFLLVLRAVDAGRADKIMKKLADNFAEAPIAIKDKHFPIKLGTWLTSTMSGDELPAVLARLDHLVRAK